MYLISGHRFPLFLAGRLPGLHHIVERKDGIRQVVEGFILGRWSVAHSGPLLA